uniref:Putative replication protein n=1 Tax=viral metagenome TaxID=1070528 RepID=A0A6M3IWJ0_9ZZZZ
MANRFTDSRKWDDPWFRKLPCKYKAFFIFLLDKCDHAGIWKIDFESAEFHIGEKLDKNEILGIMNSRIIELKEKWFIPKFINFQYQVSSITELNPENRVHKSVIELLKKEGALKGLKIPLQGCKDKDKDMVKDKDMDLDKDMVKEVIGDLNLVLGTSYKSTTKQTQDLIKARLNDSFTLEDFKVVHRKMLRAWGADDKMVKFLRPITLYGNKFEGYLNQKTVTTKLTPEGVKAYLVGQAWLKQEEIIDVR